jgi:quercetin dioxygenase-like cupin family protein
MHLSKEKQMKVVQMSKAPKKPFVSPLFTGAGVTRQDLAPDSKEYVVNVVTFNQGVRNKFHTHDSEQILIVTEGTGIVATEREKKVVTAGDVVFIPGGEKHWHGATADSDFSHIFILRQESKLTQLED